MKKFITSIFLATLIVFNFVPLHVYAEPQVQEQYVIFNSKTHKVHNPNCYFAKKCTVNCVKITKNEAGKRGAIPCKRCHIN